MLNEFRNEPFTDFSVEENKVAFQNALDQAKANMGQTYPLVIGDEEIFLDDTFTSLNPARPQEILGYFANGTAAHADQAIEVATKAFQEWKQTSTKKRAQYLFDAAEKMRERKHEFSAYMVLEVGKSWVEADADTAEAIDFMEYYARQVLQISDRSDDLTDYPSEKLTYQYIPLGVGAVIPPWNFPNAILTGMTTAALVTGNTVVLKPAEQSPLIGYKVASLLWEVGVPKGVLNFLTGPGEVVGARMVEHPKTRFVAFTGSRDVGVQIYEKASKVQPGQNWLKRSILEMGGKDATVVDENANLQAAAEGIVAGAFGFQGQKCSAGSRAIIVDSVYDQVMEKVIEIAQQTIKMGDTDSGNDINLGPVIDPEAYEKITKYIEIGKNEGKLVLGGNAKKMEDGYFIEPTIFTDVSDQARIAREEIFGPVLSAIRAKDFDDALRIANDTDYGLTGAVYSNNPDHIAKAEREYFVGNLYINRKCTGALVGVHPFGGFNMSGTDSKAGGPDYLLLFSQGKSIAEKR